MTEDSSSLNDSRDNLSDNQVNAAFSDIEKQFSDNFASQLDANLTDNYSIDPAFDDELAGLLGNKAKIALLITQIADPKFLAALCSVEGIDALIIGFHTGAGAILHNDEGSAPEEAAQKLSELIAGLSVVVCVNRADKISASHWFNGKKADDFTPPVLFASLDDAVEDLMIGSQTSEDIKIAGYPCIESSSFSSQEDAMQYIRSLMISPDASDTSDKKDE